MKEVAMWDRMRDPFACHGKFQKTNDRFTLGIPDVLGCSKRVGWALELKEFDGVRKLSVSFRPGQLDWLRDWEQAGGVSLVVTTWGLRPLVFKWQDGERLEEGCTPEEVLRLALLDGGTLRGPQQWRGFVNLLVMFGQGFAESREPKRWG